MTWLVVMSRHDEAAFWVADGLQNAGMTPCAVVTDADLVGATWHHEAGDNGLRTRIQLTDGRELDSIDVRGTINRLTHVPADMVSAISEDDRAYALQEMNALVLSWLASLPGPIVNPAHPRGLCGAWRSPAEWALLASEAGLQPLPVTTQWQSAGQTWPWIVWSASAPPSENVVVVGSAVFADHDLDPYTLAACRDYSAKVSMPILGLAFVGKYLAGITPLPDLRAGGDELINAVRSTLDTP